MKKLIPFLTLLTFLGCDKEVPIRTVFDFELGTVYVPNVVVNMPRTTEFSITPERVVSTTSYSFRYALTQGTGHFQDATGATIAQNQWTPLEGLEFSFDYVPATAETHELTVYVRENSGAYEHSQVLTYDVTNNNFTFMATATTTNVNVFIPIPVNFNINQIGEGTVNYTMTFESTGDGTLEYDGIVYTAGQVIPMNTGASSGDYVGSSGGNHIVTFTVTNDNTPPVIVEDDINVTINNYLFDFTGFPDDNTIFQTSFVNLNFDVDETEGTSPFYEMRYVFDAGNATLRDGLGNVLTPDVYYTIDDPVNGFIWALEGTDIGTVTISFYIRNHIGNEESVILNIEVEQPSDYSVTPSVASSNQYQVGGAGDLCAIHYSSRVTITATYVAGGTQLTFVSLIRTGTGQVIDNAYHVLAVGESKIYNNLVDNEEYEVHYTNTVTGEDIIKTFIAADAPPSQYITDCFPGG